MSVVPMNQAARDSRVEADGRTVDCAGDDRDTPKKAFEEEGFQSAIGEIDGECMVSRERCGIYPL